MSTWKMAWRNVWRNKRRSVTTVAAMTLALFVLILYSGLFEGYLRGMERNVLDFEVGDVQIFTEEYLDRPSKYAFIPNPDQLVADLESEGINASARLLGGALAGHGDSSSGVSLRGIYVERDGTVFRISEAIAEGEWLDTADPEGVVVGRRLAETLDVGPGDELVLFTQAMDGGSADRLYRVRGVLQGVADQTDRTAVFMTEAAFRDLLLFPEGAHQLIARRPTDSELDAVTARVRALAPNLGVRSWKELMPTVAEMLETSRGMIYVIFLIFYLVVAILILNAMLMAVFERIREFGVLKAIGGGPGKIMGLILCECLLQITLATIVGLLLALPCMWYLSQHGINIGAMAGMSVAGIAMEPIWYGVYTTQTLAMPIFMLFFIALAAALYPAMKAARISPVHAMRYQ